MQKESEQYHDLILEGMEYIKADEAIKTFGKAAHALKATLADFAEENALFFEYERDCFGTPTIKVADSEYIFNQTCMQVELMRNDGKFCLNGYRFYNFYPFNQYRKILFAADWYFKKPNKENLASLQATVQKMKVNYAAGKKIDEINSTTLNTYLDALCKKNKIKYQVEKDNTFCTVTFRLRAYYKLRVKLAYAELASQLAGIEGILHKSLELSASPLLPVISLNRSYANLWQ